MVSCTAKGLQEFQQETEGDWQVSVVPTPEQASKGLLWTFWSQVEQVSQPCKRTNKQQMLPRLELLIFSRLGWKRTGRGKKKKKIGMMPNFEPGRLNSKGHSKPFYFLPTFPHLLPKSLLSFLGAVELWNPQTCTPLGDQHYIQYFQTSFTVSGKDWITSNNFLAGT